MKAEKQELDNIGNVIGGVRDDLHAIRGALPPKSLTDSVRNMKSEVDKKANRSEVNRLRKDLKDLNTDTADPAITNRCLSCDRPLAPAPSPEQIGQLGERLRGAKRRVENALFRSSLSCAGSSSLDIDASITATQF